MNVFTCIIDFLTTPPPPPFVLPGKANTTFSIFNNFLRTAKPDYRLILSEHHVCVCVVYVMCVCAVFHVFIL